jgi:hypothetical protein
VSVCVLRGRWYNTIVLNAHAPREERSDDLKDTCTSPGGRTQNQTDHILICKGWHSSILDA